MPLITFEGIEGSGKTTQISLLENYLIKNKKKVLKLREPGGTVFGEKLRKAILESDTEISPIAEAMLFASSRAQLLKEKILPFTKKKGFVLIDRFIDSSIAYQGFARRLGLKTVLDLHQISPLDTRPDITFYINISVNESMKRQLKRGNDKDYFEREKKLFYKKLIAGYDECLKKFPKRFIEIDGNQAVENIHAEIIFLCQKMKLIS